MDLQTQRLMQAAAGASGDDKTYIDDIFSTYLYTGNASDKTITNGIDLSGEGGLVWIKRRNAGSDHALVDTERTASQYLSSNSTAGNVATGPYNNFNSFTSTGFTLKDDNGNDFFNKNNTPYSSFTFRKAPGFFDVVTYTGNSTNRSIAHNLGSTPGMIIVKCLDSSISWQVWHRGLGNGTDNQYDYALNLNSTASAASGLSSIWYQNPTSTHFSVGTNGGGNADGQEFVAYLFAHDEQSFGEDANSSVIKCGSYTSNSGGSLEINLGWEPQFLMVKNTARSSNWAVLDVMRGMDVATPQDHPVLSANEDYAEQDVDEVCSPTPTSTGFKIAPRSGGYAEYNFGTDEIIYIAIRRSDGYVGKPPELGTGVFSLATGTNNTNPGFVSGFPVDFSLRRPYASSSSWYAASRLTGTNYLVTDGNGSQVSNSNQTFDFQNGIGKWGGDLTSWMSWQWKRNAGFDVVAYTGNGTSGHSINHSLGTKSPEMIWIKRRDTSGNAGDWMVGHKGLDGGSSPWNEYLVLNKSQAEMSDNNPFNNVAPTTTSFQLSDWDRVNANNSTYIAMLFASVSGISKVGSFVGSDSDQTITLGFQPRFLIVKAYNQAYSWLQLDTTRGWATSSGNNSKYLFLELNWAQDNVDVGYLTSTGFVAKGGSGNINDAGASYIYYAHA
jgi:hypothetical protein